MLQRSLQASVVEEAQEAAKEAGLVVLGLGRLGWCLAA